MVTLRDVATLLQRAELVARISEEIEQYLVELGADGRLVRLQLRELMAGVDDERRLVVRDYFQADSSWDLEQAIETLSDMEVDDLLDAGGVAKSLHLTGQTDDIDETIQPRGYRMLARIPRLPEELPDRLVGALRFARQDESGHGRRARRDRRCRRALGHRRQGRPRPDRGVEHPRPLRLIGGRSRRPSLRVSCSSLVPTFVRTSSERPR